MAVNNANLKKIPLASDLNLNDFENEINKFTTYKHNNSKYYGGVLSNWYKKKEGTREFVGYDKKGHLWETSSSHRDLYRDNQYIGDFQDVTAKIEEYDIQDEIDELGITFDAKSYYYCALERESFSDTKDYYVLMYHDKNPTEVNCKLIIKDTSTETPVISEIGTYSFQVNQCDIAEYNCLSQFGCRVLPRENYALISVYPTGVNLDEHLVFSTKKYETIDLVSMYRVIDDLCPIPAKTLCINLNTGEQISNISFTYTETGTFDINTDLIVHGYNFASQTRTQYDGDLNFHPIGDGLLRKQPLIFNLKDCIIVNDYLFGKYTTSSIGEDYQRPWCFKLPLERVLANDLNSDYSKNDFYYISCFKDNPLQEIIGTGVSYYSTIQSLSYITSWEYPKTPKTDGILVNNDHPIKGYALMPWGSLEPETRENMSLGIIDYTFIDFKITTNTRQFQLLGSNFALHFIGIAQVSSPSYIRYWFDFYESKKDSYSTVGHSEFYNNIKKFFITNRFSQDDISNVFNSLKEWDNVNMPELNIEIFFGDGEYSVSSESSEILESITIENISGQSRKYFVSENYKEINILGDCRSVTKTSSEIEISEGREFYFNLNYDDNNAINLLWQVNQGYLQSISIGQNVITRDIEEIVRFDKNFIIYFDRNKNHLFKLSISNSLLNKPSFIGDYILFHGAKISDGLNAINVTNLKKFNYCIAFNNKVPVFINVNNSYIKCDESVSKADSIPNTIAKFLGYNYTLSAPTTVASVTIPMQYIIQDNLTFQEGYIVCAINENYEKDYLWYGSSQFAPFSIKCCNISSDYITDFINNLTSTISECDYKNYYINGLVNFYNSFDGGVVAYWFSLPNTDLSLKQLSNYSYPIASSGDILYSLGFLDVFYKNKFPYVFINDGEENYKLLYSKTINSVIFLYNLLSQNVNGLFCLQGMYFGYSDEYIFPISYEDGVINQGEAIINITGLQYIESTPTTALFWSPKNKTMYFFTGSNQFSDYYQMNKINKIVAVSYIDSTGDIFICTDNCGIIVYNHDQSLIDLDITAKEVGSVNDDIYILSEDIGVDRYSENYKSDYERQKIKIETEYFGEEDFLDSEFDTVYLKIAGSNYYSDEDYNGEVSVECSLLTQFSRKSEKKVFKFSKRDFDKDTNTLFIRYQPQYQRGIGLSVKVVSDFPISSFYINSTPVCVSNSNNNG